MITKNNYYLKSYRKILALVEDLKEKKIEDIKIVINSKQLDKKSKLRSNFEKDKKLVCIAFYSDDNSTLI